MTVALSPRRRKEVIDALRRGTVPHNGLDVLAVGLDRFESAIDAELDTVAAGGAVFKAVRGEYGSGKTFFARWLGERAKRRGMAVAEVQISETETPLHRLETVYRRVCEALQTRRVSAIALRPVLDAWLFYASRRRPAADAGTAAGTAAGIGIADHARLRCRAARLPSALQDGDSSTAEGLVAWLGGQPHVAAAVRRGAGVRGDLDHFGALRLPARACSRCCATAAIPGCCWCSTRWRPCNGSELTPGTRRSTHCVSSSTRWTPAGSPGCTW